MIELDSLILSHHPICSPANTAPEERDYAWYRITVRGNHLPTSAAVNGKRGLVEYNVGFHNLPMGIQTHYCGPVGVDYRATWSLNGFLPGEKRHDAGQAALEGVPDEGLYIREDVELACSNLLIGFVRQKLNKSHEVLAGGLAQQAKRAELAAARKAAEQQNEHHASAQVKPVNTVAAVEPVSAVELKPNWETQMTTQPQKIPQQPAQPLRHHNQHQHQYQHQQSASLDSRQPTAPGTTQVTTPRCNSLTNNAAIAPRNESNCRNGSGLPIFNAIPADRGGRLPYPPSAYKTAVQPFTNTKDSNVRFPRLTEHDHRASLARPSGSGPTGWRPHNDPNRGHVAPSHARRPSGQHISHRSHSSSISSSSSASSSLSRDTSQHSKASCRAPWAASDELAQS